MFHLPTPRKGIETAAAPAVLPSSAGFTYLLPARGLKRPVIRECAARGYSGFTYLLPARGLKRDRTG